MMRRHPCWARPRALRGRVFAAAALAVVGFGAGAARAQNPSLFDPSLVVAPVVNAGLSQPICMAFLGPNDFLVTEKATGRVKRVTGGVVVATVLDLAVNSNSERGLLGIVLDPGFAANRKYYVYWSESSTGADSNVVTEVGNPAGLPPGTPQPLGNRVDCFVLNPDDTSTHSHNVIRLRSLQHDTNNNPPNPNIPSAYQGNHDGGQIRFGPDGKLYILIGDVGRRGWMQNLANGPFLPSAPDDEWGGPAPDDAHLSSVALRLNADGTAPADNPFFAAGAALGGQVGANVQKLFSYGHRNSFGMAFDPFSGALWNCENGDDSFDEINKIVPGGNYGWVHAMGPISRVRQFKTIELAFFTPPGFGVGLIQQVRYPVTRLATNPLTALSRMLTLPGASYVDPEMSWKYAVPPSALGFVPGDALGEKYKGTMWIGEARTNNIISGSDPTKILAAGGFLMVFRLKPDRSGLDLSADPRLADKVADNGILYPPPYGTPAGTLGYKFEGTESETLLIGQNFGIVTDIVAGPDGALYAVSNTKNAVYRIGQAP